jgi:hypothetical protein
MWIDVFGEAREVRSEMRAHHLESTPEFEAISEFIEEAEAAETKLQEGWEALRQRATQRIRARGLAGAQGRPKARGQQDFKESDVLYGAQALKRLVAADFTIAMPVREEVP